MFQEILQQDVQEFVPYVFQILSLLLEYHEQVQNLFHNFVHLKHLSKFVHLNLFSGGRAPALFGALPVFAGTGVMGETRERTRLSQAFAGLHFEGASAGRSIFSW